jgi:HEAT repeat protein
MLNMVGLACRVGSICKWRWWVTIFLLSYLPVRLAADAPESFEHFLARHHIALTRDALVGALHDPDKEVRSVAAAQLAAMHATDALPDIVRAFQDERDVRTQVRIAQAATWMGSHEGLLLLEGVCHDLTLPFWIRLEAAGDAFDEKDHACIGMVLEMMQPEADAETRSAAFIIALRLKDRTEAESKLILPLALQALNDPDLRVRLQAVEVLHSLNDPTAIARLREALDEEKEYIVHSQIEFYLKDMSTKKP